MWIYILTGAICCFIGVLTEKYSNKNRDENFDSLLKNIGDLNRELYKKNNELFEAKGVIKELEEGNEELNNQNQRLKEENNKLRKVSKFYDGTVGGFKIGEFIMLKKLLNIFHCCIHCEYYDVLTHNRLYDGFCIYHKKNVKDTYYCNFFKKR